jgi:hypothetical protein
MKEYKLANINDIYGLRGETLVERYKVPRDVN